jgi:autotransporter-associated beta strand protein
VTENGDRSSQTVGSLAVNVGIVDLGNATLTVGNLNTDTTYAGIIQGNNGGLTKVGTGTLTLTGTATYSGATSVSAGKLALSTNLANTSSVSVSGGILQLTPLNTRVIVTPGLAVSGSGKIDLRTTKLIHKNGVSVIGTWNGKRAHGTMA